MGNNKRQIEQTSHYYHCIQSLQSKHRTSRTSNGNQLAITNFPTKQQRKQINGIHHHIKLQIFINSQRRNGNEIILCIKANETANCKNNNIIKICHTCKLSNPIVMKHGTENVPNTYFRGSGRIDFIIYTRSLLLFISSDRILLFGMT